MKTHIMYFLLVMFLTGITITSCSIDDEILSSELSTGDEADDPVGPDEDN